MMQKIFVLHVFCTLYMTGVIWFVQLVHYPLYFGIIHDDYKMAAKKHQMRTSLVVLIPMLLELITGVYLLYKAQTIDWWITMGLLGLVWVSTFTMQVPCHRTLEQGYSTQAYNRLVSSNWFRTIFWTVRSFLFFTVF